MSRPLPYYPSNTWQTCNYYTEAGSGKLPRINYNEQDLVQPCAEVVISNDMTESIATGFVATAICQIQRELGICPRQLGVEIKADLIPPRMQRRK